jgi:hypothetical protein
VVVAVLLVVVGPAGIWLVDLNCMMMHGLANFKLLNSEFIVHFDMKITLRHAERIALSAEYAVPFAG